MPFCNIVDQLHYQDRLPDTGASEKTDLSAFHIRFQKVYYLDACVEHFLRSGEFIEFRRFPVDRCGTGLVETAHAVDAVSRDIHQPSFHLVSYRHRDRLAFCSHRQMPLQPVSGIHRYRADRILSDMLLHFHDQLAAVIFLYGHCLVDAGKHVLFPQIREVDIDYRSYYL